MNEKSNTKTSLNVKRLYPVNDVENGYNYWLSKLLQFTLTAFDYKGLPPSLPQREIEVQLQLYGHCLIFEKNGELLTCRSSLTGVGKYYNPTQGVYTQPTIGSGNVVIDSFNNVVIYNTLIEDNIDGLYLDNTTISFCARYARLLADTESTYTISCINKRKHGFPVAKSETAKRSWKSFFSRLTMGYYDSVYDEELIRPTFDYMSEPSQNYNVFSELLFARDKILEQFFRDLGIKFTNQKKSQISVEEVESDTQVLVVGLDGMLAERKKGINKLNEMFNLNVSVDLNEKFKRDNFTENVNLMD